MAPPIKYTTEAERREARIASKKRYYQKHKELEQEKARLRWKARVERERAGGAYAPRQPHGLPVATIDERFSGSSNAPSSSVRRQDTQHGSPAESPPASPEYEDSSDCGSDLDDSFEPSGRDRRHHKQPTMMPPAPRLRREQQATSYMSSIPQRPSPNFPIPRGPAGHIFRPPSPSDRFLPPKNRPAVWPSLTGP
ncbi:hypothetical protein AURDEDRAFT_187962, partial [Auricularia subglabra TFB-10046 SS5]